MNEQHLRPGPSKADLPSSPEAEGESAPVNPWEIREELGWPRAAYQASRLFLSNPRKGFDRTRPRGGFRGPLLFALLVTLVAGFASETTNSLYKIAFGQEGSGNAADVLSLDLEVDGEPVRAIQWLSASALGLAGFAGCVLGLLLGVPILLVVYPLVLLVWSGVLHLCLWSVGGLRDSKAGFQGTWAAICYAAAAFVPGVIPLIGDWLTLLGLGILQVVGFWRLHRVSPTRASVAVLLPLAIPACLLLVGWLSDVSLP